MRKQNEDDLDQLISDWTKDFDAAELVVLLQSARVSAGLVEKRKDLSEDSQLKYRSYFRELDHPEIGNYFTESTSFVLSETPADFEMPAPV